MPLHHRPARLYEVPRNISVTDRPKRSPFPLMDEYEFRLLTPLVVTELCYK
jgi:hypothetical protein